MWISRSDGLIRRVSWSHPGSGSIEVTQVRLNEPVTPAQLTHEAPLSLRLRFEAKSHALGPAAVVSALSPAVGFVFWRALWRRCTERQADLASRRRSWARYRQVGWWTVPAAFLVAFLAPTGGDMSGAATTAMRVVWAAVYTFLVVARRAFLAARHCFKR